MIADDDSRRAALVAALPGAGPVVLSRAPGRVNIIGEHTDYNGLPVLPFAGGGDVLVAARPRTDGVVEAANLDARFARRRFAPGTAIPPFVQGDWGNYVKAATQALATAGMALPAGGASLLVDGQIPAAAGMSSSSALVVACALAILGLRDRSIDPRVLAELLARGEQYVGTLSGGMDQAAILLGRPGHALRIDFHPLRARPVPVPCEAAFIVAQTGEEAPKAGAARGRYNQRVVECRVACALLGRRLQVELPNLGALADPTGVLDALADLLPDGAVTRDALVRRFGLTASAVEQLVPPSVALAEPNRFVLRARVRYVLQEAARVASVETALARRDLEAVGALLDASHGSAAMDYGTSTAAADALVRVGREAGALGGRLMGAGFGGSVLFLTRREHAGAVLAALDQAFYRGAARQLRCVVAPSAGAAVARVDCEPAVC